MAAPKVKFLIEKCGRCHGLIASDNRGTGKPWVHLDGEPADGHFPHFGVVLERKVILEMCQRIEISPLEAEPVERGIGALPPPEIPGRPATDEQIGLSNRIGRRQILNAAEREGFTTDVRYSRGWIADQWGRPGRVTDSIGIFGIHDDGRVFHAWWIEDSHGVLEFQNARCYGLVGFHGQRELVRYIRGEEVATQPPTR
jgi:hypothetical protein